MHGEDRKLLYDPSFPAIMQNPDNVTIPGGVDKLAMLGEQVSLRMIDRAAIPINFTL